MKKKTSFGMNADLSMETVSSVKTTQAFEWVFYNHDKQPNKLTELRLESMKCK